MKLSRRSVLAATAALTLPASAHAQSAAEWRRIEGANAPSPRYDHTLSADSERKRLIVAFGRDGAGTPLGDAFIGDRGSGDWEPIVAERPAPRFGHAAAIDRERSTLLLFGGQAGDQFYNDLWALDLDSLTWELIDDGAGGPTPRYGTSLVHDEADGLIVSHGFTFEGRFDDTWRFDLNELSWSDVSPDPATRPLKRCLHDAIWNHATSSMWLYAGCSSGYGPCPQDDLWEFRDGAWSTHEIGGVPGRMNAGLAYDRDADRLLIFGGDTANGRAADLWSGIGPEWSPVEIAGPEARGSHDMVYSAGAVYLFGGLTDAGVTNDLWRLKL